MGATCGYGAQDIELDERRTMLRQKRAKAQPTYNQTYQARADVEAIWTTIDTNGNGVLEKEEFRAFYEQNLSRFWVSFSEEVDVYNYNDFFDFVDKNGNGTIEKEELIDFLAK